MPKQTTGPGEFSQDQGRTLLMLARQTISARLGKNPALEEVAALEARLADPALAVKRGAFVCLHLHGELRGCIGSLCATESLIDSIRHNAINSAFCDRRFLPLAVEELDAIDLEISILTESRPLSYSSADDLLAKLRPNIDGVIIRLGAACATFLPQVWEQLPVAEDFLRHLCCKAGLQAEAWRNCRLEVQTYQVQLFKEKD